MVCPKLKKGNCNISSKKCNQPYDIKMIHFLQCPIYIKFSGGKVTKVAKVKIKKSKKKPHKKIKRKVKRRAKVKRKKRR